MVCQWLRGRAPDGVAPSLSSISDGAMAIPWRQNGQVGFRTAYGTPGCSKAMPSTAQSSQIPRRWMRPASGIKAKVAADDTASPKRSNIGVPDGFDASTEADVEWLVIRLRQSAYPSILSLTTGMHPRRALRFGRYSSGRRWAVAVRSIVNMNGIPKPGSGRFRRQAKLFRSARRPGDSPSPDVGRDHQRGVARIACCVDRTRGECILRVYRPTDTN